jgi:hypothetical protein
VRRVAGMVTVACMALAALPPGASAEALDPDMICPDMFVPFPAQIAPAGTDKNGNFIVCVKEAGGMLIWRDDLLKPEES